MSDNSSAPLPLSYAKAVQQGLKLRLTYGWSYTVISQVVGHYHGFHRGVQWWERVLKEHGAPPRHDYGASNLKRWAGDPDAGS